MVVLVIGLLTSIGGVSAFFSKRNAVVESTPEKIADVDIKNFAFDQKITPNANRFRTSTVSHRPNDKVNVAMTASKPTPLFSGSDDLIGKDEVILPPEKLNISVNIGSALKPAEDNKFKDIANVVRGSLVVRQETAESISDTTRVIGVIAPKNPIQPIPPRARFSVPNFVAAPKPIVKVVTAKVKSNQAPVTTFDLRTAGLINVRKGTR